MEKEQQYGFFGSAHQSLWGAYHAPNMNKNLPGVLLCNSIGQEGLRAHRALIQLTSQLNSLGFPVLRFDYYGCGNSMGEMETGSLTLWEHDIAEAAEQLQRKSHCSHLALIGLRLGANLALRSATALARVTHLVLWEPVTDGRSYLDELQAQHRQHVQKHLQQTPSPWPEGRGGEALGFEYSNQLVSEILQLTPQNWAAQSPPILTQYITEAQALARHLPPHWTSTPIAEPNSLWASTNILSKGLVPMQTIQATIKWLTAHAHNH